MCHQNKFHFTYLILRSCTCLIKGRIFSSSPLSSLPYKLMPHTSLIHFQPENLRVSFDLSSSRAPQHKTMENQGDEFIKHYWETQMFYPTEELDRYLYICNLFLIRPYIFHSLHIIKHLFFASTTFSILFL